MSMKFVMPALKLNASIVAIGVVLAGLSSHPSPSVAEQAASRAATGMAVTVTRARRTCFRDTLRVMGVLVAREEILVRPDRDGYNLSQILVEAGDTVTSGQVLARISPSEGQQGSTATITAPLAGLVVSAPTVIGVMVSGRGDPLFRIVVAGEMELSAEITAKRVPSLSPGQPATIQISGIPELQGRVRIVSNTVDPNTQLGQVRIFIGRGAKLRPGIFGRAVINVGQSCGIAIPLSAVLYGPEGAVVQVVRDNRIETRRVAVGLLSGGQVEVREGLQDGDNVVARAGAFLREGDRVRAVGAAEPAAKK